MYSPKIREDLVTELYKHAKIRDIKMTVLVNEIIESFLINQETGDGNGKS